jgi:hypothetical protein
MLRNVKARLVGTKQLEFPGKKILLVSLQKCGTHLIEGVFDVAGLEKKSVSGDRCSMSSFLGMSSENYICSHFTPADDIQMALEENKGVYIIFNFRDPRDVLVSWFHWMHPSNPMPMHAHMRYMQKVYATFTDEELINIFLTNDKFRAVEYNPLEAFRLSRVLLFHPKVLKVRFEDLVGPQGGGNRTRQVDAIRQIYDYLELGNVDPERVADAIFSKDSPTFRKGQIGTYKEFLSEQQLDLFNRLHGDIMRQYGYNF